LENFLFFQTINEQFNLGYSLGCKRKCESLFDTGVGARSPVMTILRDISIKKI
jgi:hypothetical protein